MLDYTANGVVYWNSEKIKTKFVENCQIQKKDPQKILAHFLEDVVSEELFWKKVETNLQLGKVRMIFVADLISPELQQIVEFLNKQMNPAEVLAVEVKQYLGAGFKALVPRVVGQTVEARQKKGSESSDFKLWNTDSFFQTLEEQQGTEQSDVAKRILEWANENCFSIRWGKGKQYGGFTVRRALAGGEFSLFRVWTNGAIDGFPCSPRFRLDPKWLSLTEKISNRLRFKKFAGSFVPGASVPLIALTEESTLTAFFDVINSVTSDNTVFHG